MEYEIHPAAMLFPLMGEAELAEMAMDIKEHGQHVPIVLHQGKILDGRNRYAACKLAIVEPIVETANDIDSPVLYVLSLNLHRRHLTIGQRGAIAADCVPMLKEEAKERQRNHAGTAPGRSANNTGAETCISDSGRGATRDIAAKQLGVSHYIVDQALTVKRSDHSLHEQVKSGAIPLAEAHRVATGVQPKSSHREKVDNNKKERIINCLSQIRGLCISLDRLGATGLTKEERIEWSKQAFQLSKRLRTFAQSLKAQ